MRVWDSKTHSFIVKIWLEETAEEDGKARWRGHVTHVGDEQRRYVETLDDLSAFIGSYLEEMGVRSEPRSRLGRWLNRWTRH